MTCHLFDFFILINIARLHWLRMADFDESREILSRCLGCPENAFDAYREPIDNENDEIIESSSGAESIITFMENKKRWTGTPTQLLQQLGDIISQVNSNIRKSKYWLKAPSRLTKSMTSMKNFIIYE